MCDNDRKKVSEAKVQIETLVIVLFMKLNSFLPAFK